MRFKIAITLALVPAVFAGCQQHGKSVSSTPDGALTGTSTNAAIRTAIQAHLAHNGNLRLDSFDTTVKQITTDGDHAQAQVEFRAKGGSGTMQFSYALAKRDSTWYVVESNSGGSNFSHPTLAGSQTPSQNGSIGADSSVFQMLDNLHGRTAGNSQTLPPGHPPVVTSREEKQAQVP